MSNLRSSSTLMGISVTAIAIALVAIFVASYSLTNISTTVLEDDEDYVPQTREIWLFSQVDEHIEEEKYNIPPDQFSLDSIVVNEGDDVKIHFYNLEPIESQEHHTFTIQAPYEMNYDINAGENVEIEFTATESGIFDYICTFHEPTMRGQLVVLDD